MNLWTGRSTGERAGIVAGAIAAILAVIFGVTEMGPPPRHGDGERAAARDGDAKGDPDAIEAGAEDGAAAEGEAEGADPAAEAAATDTAAADADAAAADEPDATEATSEGTAAEATETADGAEGGATETAAAEADAAATDAGAAEPAAPPATELDLVRVSRDGSAVIAGNAAAGATIRLMLDGAEIGTIPADAQGNFVALFNLAPSEAPRVLTLSALLPDGTEVPAEGRIAISPTVAPSTVAAAAAADAGTDAGTAATEEPAAEAEAPAALFVTEEGARVLQSAETLSPALAANVTVDAITYSPEGEVQLAGRGTGGAVVRLYLNNAQVSDTTVDGQGGWAVTLSDIAPGLYTLRADQIDQAGKVTSRFETPFQRETVEALAAAAEAEAAAAAPAATEAADATATEGAADATTASAEAATETAPVSVTVQPGFTLWRIARENLGDGVLYVQVFEANKSQIRDPDLIYPGQVFTIPKSE